mgnify:CR=1 FL=1
MYRGFAPVSTIVRYNRCKGFAKSGQVLCRACKVCKVLGKGGGGVRSYEWIGRQRGDGAAAEGPSKPLRPRGLGQLPCEGSLLRGRSPREKPPHQGRWPRSRPEGFSPLTGSIAKSRAGHARPLRTAVNWLRTRGAREGGSPPLCSVRRLPGNGLQRIARRNPPVT